MSYTVTRHKYGMVIEGMVPMGDLSTLLEAWERDGLDVLDVGIAWHFRANSVVTTAANSALWRDEIAEKLAAQYPGDKPMQWLHGCDVGASSCYLFSLICDDSHRQHARSMMDRFGYTGDVYLRPYPRDADDWARCVRMLEHCGWWDRVDAVKDILGASWARWWAVAI